MEPTENKSAYQYQSPIDDTKPKIGRPTLYSLELAEEICALIANGSTMQKISKIEGMPEGETMRRWQKENPSFHAMYSLAREMRADARSDRIDDYAAMLMAGNLMPDVARVLIDTEKWQASKENFRRYGDKQAIEQTNTHNHNVVISDMSTASLLAELQRTAQALPGGVRLNGDRLEISGEYVDVTPIQDDKHKG